MALPMESVWDYPRPPRVEPSARRARVVFAERDVADSAGALRVLETSQPPAIYIPGDDVALELLEPSARHTFCEWKGVASYYDIVVGERRAADAAWHYPEPTPPYAELAGHIAFYPARVDGCFLDDERVATNEGDFYGGWITRDIAGPFKGAPGTEGW
jgi:uncharacterized protein (DUF427 family)